MCDGAYIIDAVCILSYFDTCIRSGVWEDNKGSATCHFTDIQEMGGVQYIVLSHRDDVADHAKWAEHFPEAARIIHKLEANSYQGTK